jgi:hypothetical protein
MSSYTYPPSFQERFETVLFDGEDGLPSALRPSWPLPRLLRLEGGDLCPVVVEFAEGFPEAFAAASRETQHDALRNVRTRVVMTYTHSARTPLAHSVRVDQSIL